jgi:hypothetical protein
MVFLPAPPPVPACTVEDASSGPVPCVWLGSEDGNGAGLSFRVFANGNFKYITVRQAKRLRGI